MLNSLNHNPDSDIGDIPDSDTGDTEEIDYDLLPPPKLSKLLELKKMYKYSWSIYRGYIEQATSVGKVMTNLAGIIADNYTQTTIDQ